jgi:hypothetical protein
MIISLQNVDIFIEDGWKGDSSVWNCIRNEAFRKIYRKKEQESIENKTVSAL